MIKIKKIEKFIIVILVALTIIRVGIALRNPTHILQVEGLDDNLFYIHTDGIIHGKWLGDYEYGTLSKRISFPIFIAICYELMIPYNLGLMILNISSAILICLAFKKKINKWFLYLIYLLLIFSPTGFTTLISQRSYRNAILPYGVLYVFSVFIGMYLRKEEPVKNIIPWSIIGCITFPFFWHIKEDSIWVLPFIIVINFLFIINLLLTNKKDKKELIKKFVLIFLPFISLLIINIIISYLNYSYYGVFLISDKGDGEFGRMISNMYKIEDEEKSDDIWISKKMLNDLSKVSPTFNTLQPEIVNNAAWLNEDGEVLGDLIIWKIRYIMTNAGYFENAVKVQEFSREVNQDIEKAFKDGTLKKNNNKIYISSQMRGLTIKEIFDYFPKTIQMMDKVSNYEGCGISINTTNTGDPNKIQYIQSVLGVITKDKGDLQDVSHRSEKVSNLIVDGFKKASFIINILAIIGYLLYTIKMVTELISKKFEKLDIWFSITGIILSALVACLELVLFLDYLPDKLISRYRAFFAAGIFPLIQLFKYVSIYMLIMIIVNFVKAKIVQRKQKNIDIKS